MKPMTYTQLLRQIQEKAEGLAEAAPQEASGVRDGDGLWHGSDPIDAYLSDLGQLHEQLKIVQAVLRPEGEHEEQPFSGGNDMSSLPKRGDEGWQELLLEEAHARLTNLEILQLAYTVRDAATAAQNTKLPFEESNSVWGAVNVMGKLLNQMDNHVSHEHWEVVSFFLNYRTVNHEQTPATSSDDLDAPF